MTQHETELNTGKPAVRQGMILAADDGQGNLRLVEPDGEMTSGATVR